MPYAFMFQSADVDQAGYDQVMKGLGRGPIDSPNPAGFIAHLAGPRAEGGWRVVDLWQSKDAAAAFYGSPTFEQAVMGSGFKIDTEEWPMHRVEVDQTLRHLD